jgi:ABC-type lipoprotein export system ATPase subunit
LDSILSLRHVSRTYFKETLQVSALKDISMDVNPGEFVSIVGRSGSGKSTLLNLIGGLDTATSGQVFCKGADLSAMSRKELAGHRRNAVGMIFQSFNLIPSRTAAENVELALIFGRVPKRQRKEKTEAALGRLGLAERIRHKPGELSGGEAQRVAIARALANRPDILLADEPSGNLDSKTSEEILTLLKELNRDGLTILMVTHDERMAESVSSRIVRLLDGQIVEDRKIGRAT